MRHPVRVRDSGRDVERFSFRRGRRFCDPRGRGAGSCAFASRRRRWDDAWLARRRAGSIRRRFLDGFFRRFFGGFFRSRRFLYWLLDFLRRRLLLRALFQHRALADDATRFAGFLRVSLFDGLFSWRRHRKFLIAQTRLLGMPASERGYRVASASSPNTEKTSGFRSRLYSAVSRAARLIFSHTSASRARRGRFSLALASSACRRSLTQRSTLSMKAASATRSLPPSASPSA